MEPIQEPIQAIIEAVDADPLFGQQNPFNTLSSLVLEARKAGLAWDKLEPTYQKLRKSREVGPGLYRRTPKGMWSHEMSFSHDEILGLVMLSHLFDGGHTAREMWLARNWLGLYVSGKNEKGHWLDSEFFTPWRPEYRAIWKLCMGMKLTLLEDAAMRLNIITSKAWNMKRIRLLFLEGIGYDSTFLMQQTEILGDKWRGRYGNDPLFWSLWTR
jgi:hypothetical protein